MIDTITKSTIDVIIIAFHLQYIEKIDPQNELNALVILNQLIHFY